MADLRSISTRAEITPTRFWNEYQWGDLKADPAELLARYFDVHLYFANWGTRRLMFRLPAARSTSRRCGPTHRAARRPSPPGATTPSSTCAATPTSQTTTASRAATWPRR